MMIKHQGLAVEGAKAGVYVPVPADQPLGRQTISLILLAALIVNAAIVLMALPEVRGALAPAYSMSFGDLYDGIAKNLDQGKGYRVDPGMGSTMVREPGYPLLLAAVFELGGYGIQQARAVCVILAFGAALILLRLTREITGDATAALVAALLFLLYPGTLVAEARAGIEIPSVFTVVLFILVLYRAVERGCTWRYGAAGLLMGVAVLVRSQILLFPLPLLVYLCFVARGWVERRKVIEGIAMLAVGVGVVMSPWIIRNYILVHKFIPTASVVGISAQEGLYTCESAAPGDTFAAAQTKAGFKREEVARQLGIPFKGPYYQLFYTPYDEVTFNHALLSGVLAVYRSHPRILATCAAKNLFFNFWFLGKEERSILLNLLIQGPLLGLALAGIAILRTRGLLRKAGIILLYILYIPMIQAPIIAHARHSMLIAPFLALLGAVTLVRVWQVWRKQNSSAHLQQGFVASGA